MFWFIVSFVISQRLIELGVAKHNERNMLAHGAYEVGSSHYRWMIMLHMSFFISLIAEVSIGRLELSPLFVPLFIAFLFVQTLRIWCLLSLGSFWNTKIIVLPGTHIVKKGPYKFFKHPNYAVVVIEILLLPLMFQAYFTTCVFTLLNLVMLSVRIPLEEHALMIAANFRTRKHN